MDFSILVLSIIITLSAAFLADMKDKEAHTPTNAKLIRAKNISLILIGFNIITTSIVVNYLYGLELPVTRFVLRPKPCETLWGVGVSRYAMANYLLLVMIVTSFFMWTSVAAFDEALDSHYFEHYIITLIYCIWVFLFVFFGLPLMAHTKDTTWCQACCDWLLINGTEVAPPHKQHGPWDSYFGLYVNMRSRLLNPIIAITALGCINFFSYVALCFLKLYITSEYKAEGFDGTINFIQRHTATIIFSHLGHLLIINPTPQLQLTTILVLLTLLLGFLRRAIKKKKKDKNNTKLGNIGSVNKNTSGEVKIKKPNEDHNTIKKTEVKKQTNLTNKNIKKESKSFTHTKVSNSPTKGKKVKPNKF